MLSEIRIQGLVQGVGFRPFIYLLAKEMDIKGEVFNRNNGVVIRAELSAGQSDEFISRIRTQHPPVASVHRIELVELPEKSVIFKDFTILSSLSESDEVTQVAPDIAVCEQCLDDRKTQAHRVGYPFINCTHCGPRFSIVRDLPYDRSQTTMSGFGMCPDCRKEYDDLTNRRFHAQPVACNHCGPAYYADFENKIYTDYAQLLALACRLLNDGKVIAVKGVGGYHLVCDALCGDAVESLRKIKIRDTKPFALMFKDIQAVSSSVFLNETEKDCLLSWRRPIVLLKEKNGFADKQDPAFPPLKVLHHFINPGMKTMGCMLPYMPIHYDWFAHLRSPVLVMTSANLNDRPIIIDPEEAETQLTGKVDLLLHHNRPVHNRVDDSVLQVCGEQVCLIRRSRGYVPEPFFADIPTEGILAFGAEKVNTFALGKDDTVIQSQYIGDLKNDETFRFYTESMERFERLFRFTPKQLVCDLHPDYLSSLHAGTIASEKRLPLLRVQHHHAHAVAGMLEFGLHNPLIAVVWDGIGLGDDGAAWGGEFFLCDRRRYTRLSHPEYVPMPGGDKAAYEPWRMAVACLHHYRLPVPAGLVRRIGKEKIDLITEMMDKKINSPLTSSIGRLFDAFASLTGVCDMATRQAEAAVLLEQQAEDDCKLRYPVEAGGNPFSLYSLFSHALEDLQNNVPAGIMAAKFHHFLADLIVEKVREISEETGIKQVIVSGGCFQNKRLAEEIRKLFSYTNISLYLPGRIPCNDSGIAVGQLVVAASQ
ncbi:MAG: carbamoyltransferase HypF [Candidatus Symbiothrix sp.]|jgi:hydrogenase maturation protein HypF|nr:carbamoyltransferase HypF [Candidatus Symbiothrix sp.]